MITSPPRVSLEPAQSYVVGGKMRTAQFDESGLYDGGQLIQSQHGVLPPMISLGESTLEDPAQTAAQGAPTSPEECSALCEVDERERCCHISLSPRKQAEEKFQEFSAAQVAYQNARTSYKIESATEKQFEQLHRLHAAAAATKLEWEQSEERATIGKALAKCQQPAAAGLDGVGCGEGGDAAAFAQRGMRNIARVDDLEAMIRRTIERVIRKTANERLVDKQQTWVASAAAELSKVQETQTILEDRVASSEAAEAAANPHAAVTDVAPTEVQLSLASDTRLAKRRASAHKELVQEVRDQLDQAEAALGDAKRARASIKLATHEGLSLIHISEPTRPY
eukprot:TRINITY_DN15489_c0_g1_i1.p1 TRINITY_DN15489_c0_g1~~TRINITY_DN15489_c0_g1_i1.p1  ORF type:complete len:338 (-),score=77.58 TRINITY_DN15489_c0_g1_i1:53-1066(-)